MFSTSSCRDELEMINPNPEKITSRNGRTETITGLKLTSPYTLSNMQRALDSVWQDSSFQESQFATLVKSQFSIQSTHQYIKFTPTTEEEEYLLKSDSSLVLFDYPLDYEFTEEELSNRQAPASGIAEYYTTVSVGQVLPTGVSYEVLEELYFLDGDSYFDNITEAEENQASQRGIINTKQDFLRNLLYKAHAQVGALDELFAMPLDSTSSDPDPEPDPEPNPDPIDVPDPNPTLPGAPAAAPQEPTVPTFWLFGKKWRPSGRITIHDDIITNDDNNVSTDVPLQGAKVVMRNRLYRVAKALTNDFGIFEANRRVRGKIRYVLKWDRKHWSIRNGTFGQAETKGPRVKNKPWIHHIRGGKSEYFGTIHRAAHNYYYKDIDGLRRPPRAGWNFFPWFPPFLHRRQVKISAMLKDDGANNNWHHVNMLPYQPISTIRISRFGANTLAVFGTATHELAHSTNAFAGIYEFLTAKRRLRETYANTIEWHLLNKFYTDWAVLPLFNINTAGGANPNNPISDTNPFRHEESYQDHEILVDDIYTSLMVDLIDTENQVVTRANILLPTDRFSGFTINEIEDEMMNSRNFRELEGNLQSYLTTQDELDRLRELFANWD